MIESEKSPHINAVGGPGLAARNTTRRQVKNPPAIVVLATGGTIAGQTTTPDEPGAYSPGVMDVASLLALVPELDNYALVKGVQVSNIGSEHMNDDVWLRLLEASSQILSAPGVDGVVVLHGTDTLEETAFFLDCTLSLRKPLVFTGAMRPANAVSTDGPMNILNAVRLAASPEAVGRGVLVVMNDGIHAAREIVKTDTLNLDAFQSPNAGPLGRMLDGVPMFRAPAPLGDGDKFSLVGLPFLPRVEIVYGHAGQRREFVDAAVAVGAKGIVHAGVGAGCVHQAVLPALQEAVDKGVAVVCASRVGKGPAVLNDDFRKYNFISAGELNPQKARVLLQLALTRTKSFAALQEIFTTR